ncbi:hypothetical protein O7626_19390 [Micromonospora sp. WMMD1102]|uniref:hypothetical protein n=1 Tax=Micromonospora sp. WMMD1102 TaxID=3016105 RepID=UPI002415618B|nr:hypothetical protein [Micromonospora sp. WMMD1102]MDG4788078.1 hypothetical protein [Micromonospora sp. WMMD1102]
MNAVALWLLQQLLAALRLLLAGLIALAIWASPRIWRGLVAGSLAAVDLVERASIGAYRRWDSRHDAVVVEELGQQRELTSAPHGHVLWSEIVKEIR